MPKPGFTAYIKRGQTMVRRYGWMVQAVLANDQQPTYSYSVGLSTTFSHPEIFMVGFHPDMCRSLINVAGNHIKGGMRFDAPCLSDVILESFPAAFLPVHFGSAYDHSNAGRAILGHSFDAVQLFLPDAAGLFPWESGCDPQYAAVQTSLLLTVSEPPARQ
jgi:hypothetical protein